MPTIPELLSTKGYLTGLVATSSITHATPAAFYAHINSRSKHKQIAQMLVESDIAIALGGGSEFFKLPLSDQAIHIIDNGNSLDQDNLSSACKGAWAIWLKMGWTEDCLHQRNFK